jgi:glycosyltransferase involved in cell wall biosynthesis
MSIATPSTGRGEAVPEAERLRALDVALVHDYLNQRGGAERVILELSDIWPRAPIYTSLYRPSSTLPGFEDRDVRTTFLDRLPVDRGFRNLFPLYPAAFKSLGEIDADVVIASSSGWAHMARARPDALHVVYCHTPARWLYRDEYLDGGGRRSNRGAIVRAGGVPLRSLDRAAARRADVYIANSLNTKRRIRELYGIDAHVIHPPVDVERFRPTPRGERLLVVSRLLPYKHVDLAVRVATRLGIGLDVVGDGPLLARLRELAGPTVALHGAVDDATVVELMESCRAVCVLAEEDFGIVSVEAQAAGKPVVAYGRGGSLETIAPGVSGVFFDHHTEACLINAIETCNTLDSSPEEVATHASRFSRQSFQTRLHSVLMQATERQAARRSTLTPAQRHRR